MRRVLVTARVFLKDEQAVEQLKRAGFQVVEAAFAGRPSEDELISALQGFDAVIAGTEAYTERVLRSLPKLRAIARWGVGVDAIDVAAATRAGVAVLNTPGPIAESVADLTFALMLGIARRICEGDARVRAGKWGPVEGTLVWGKVLGIVGVGAIGTAVARRARGFNMTVLGYDPSPRPEAAELGVEFVHLDTLLRRADFVTLHAPLTPETRNMIGRRELSLMKPTAYLINCARGGLVDQEALTEALRNGTIGGAALDVFEEEPPPLDDPLLSCERCLLSPHTGSFARETMQAVSRQVAENLIAVFCGLGTPNCVNPSTLGRPAPPTATG